VKLVALILAAALSAVLLGCGGSADSQTSAEKRAHRADVLTAKANYWIREGKKAERDALDFAASGNSEAAGWAWKLTYRYYARAKAMERRLKAMLAAEKMRVRSEH
jgi:hypothetical protein